MKNFLYQFLIFLFIPFFSHAYIIYSVPCEWYYVKGHDPEYPICHYLVVGDNKWKIEEPVFCPKDCDVCPDCPDLFDEE